MSIGLHMGVLNDAPTNWGRRRGSWRSLPGHPPAVLTQDAALVNAMFLGSLGLLLTGVAFVHKIDSER